MKKMECLVVTHKEYNNFLKDRKIIAVGHNKDAINADYKDNEGINIAEKNYCYCELTAIYWAWKNLKCDYISIEHYRRYFCNFSLFKPRYMTMNQMERTLDKYDCILSKKYKFQRSIEEKYKQAHYIEDLNKCKNIISKDYPQYTESFNKFIKGNSTYLFNMLVMKKVDFDAYCSWLFDILFKLEEQIDISDRTDYQKRCYGFLSERLLNVWINKNNIKAKKKNVYFPKANVFMIRIKRLFGLRKLK